MHALSLALATLALSTTAMAQQAPALPHAPTVSAAADRDMSRAEVLADLEMWQRAGMPHLADRELGQQSAEYLRGLERYRQLLAGPAFREAVARLEARHIHAGR